MIPSLGLFQPLGALVCCSWDVCGTLKLVVVGEKQVTAPGAMCPEDGQEVGVHNDLSLLSFLTTGKADRPQRVNPSVVET